MQLRTYQSEAIAAVYEHLRTRDDNPCVVLPTGCHAQGHPILMFDGSLRPVENVAVGDVLMGPDSTPRRVLALCRGEDDLYRVTPVKGEPFVVNGDHVLSLVCTNEGKGNFPCQKRGGEIEQVAVREFLTKPHSWRHLRKLYRVGVEFSQPCDLPIPPYILGLLLGDGCIRDGVHLTTMDPEIADAWGTYAASIGCDVSVIAQGGRCPTYTLTGNRGRANVVTESLSAFGLSGTDSGTKFVPREYLVASREQRLHLLAGLLDTDGSLCRTGFDYITKSVMLASDVVFLARSLGLAAYCVQKFSYCQTGNGGWYYRISVSGDTDRVPCRLPRKRARDRRQKKSVLRTGFSVTSAGHGPFYGFTLDADHLYVDGHFVVHHNSGKTPLIATICRDAVTRWNGRVVILAHVKELLEQTAEKLRVIAPDVPMGIYSAGLKRMDLGYSATVAGIQSIWKKACDLGPVDLIIVDEAHMVPAEDDGMYRQFIADAKVVNPNVRVIGLTATPYRMKSGSICAAENILNHVCYEVGVRELIVQGFLSPLKTKAGLQKISTDDLHVRAGEFVASEVEDLMDKEGLVEGACAEIAQHTKNRIATLIFSSGIRHGQHIVDVLKTKHGIECGFVTGDTPDGVRAAILGRFRSGELKYLCNVNVLTTGFDAPHIDCVALVRPTMSPGLYYQMVGRGFRLHSGKTDCLVLDFGGNVLRHGPVDAIRIATDDRGDGEAPAKECPNCQALIAAGYQTCPQCGHVFPEPNKQQHESKASTEGILSGQTTREEHRVSETTYHVHSKRSDPSAPLTMRVEYRVGFNRFFREWVCFDHTGYARTKAEAWWRARSAEPAPECTEHAVELAEAGALAPTLAITVEKKAGDQFERVSAHLLGERPARLDDPGAVPDAVAEPAGTTVGIPDDEIPF